MTNLKRHQIIPPQSLAVFLQSLCALRDQGKNQLLVTPFTADVAQAARLVADEAFFPSKKFSPLGQLLFGLLRDWRQVGQQLRREQVIDALNALLARRELQTVMHGKCSDFALERSRRQVGGLDEAVNEKERRRGVGGPTSRSDEGASVRERPVPPSGVNPNRHLCVSWILLVPLPIGDIACNRHVVWEKQLIQNFRPIATVAPIFERLMAALNIGDSPIHSLVIQIKRNIQIHHKHSPLPTSQFTTIPGNAACRHRRT